MTSCYNITKKGTTYYVVPLHEPDGGILSKSAYFITLVSNNTQTGYHVDSLEAGTLIADINNSTPSKLDPGLEEKIYHILSIWQQ
jgi:hypothetical protein